MSLKAQLKAARSALASDEYGLALSSADRVLAFETDNYLALVFRAAALEGLGRIPDAEQAFEKSISTKPEESLAWDGLIKLYRKLGRWDAVSVTLRRLADALFAAGNAVKLAETLQALLHLVQQSAGQDQVRSFCFHTWSSAFLIHGLLRKLSDVFAHAVHLFSPHFCNPAGPSSSPVSTQLTVLCHFVHATRGRPDQPASNHNV